MKHLIIIKDREKARDYIRKIFNNINFLDVKRYLESDEQILVQTQTDEYEWVKGNTYFTGQSCDVLHLENGVDLNLLNTVYIPLLSGNAEKQIIFVDTQPKYNLVQMKFLDTVSKYTIPQHIKNEILFSLADIDEIILEYLKERFSNVTEEQNEQDTNFGELA